MKILHMADLHLGAKNNKLPSDKQSQMKSESLMQVQTLFEMAKNDNYDVILICGDLFHSAQVTNKIKNTFFTCVTDFNKPVIFINGNHDEFFVQNELLPQNFIILNKQTPCVEIEDVVFWGKPSKELLESNFDSKKKNVLLIHGNIENSSDYDYVDISVYKSFKFDYVAMGHTHTYKVFNLNKVPYVYSGSLFSNGFDECGAKGYVRLELEKEAKFNFIPFAKRKYMICECDISDAKGYYSILNKIRQILLTLDITKDDLVRVILTGEYEEGLDKNEAVISQSFNHLFYFEMQDKSRIKIDIEKLKNEVLSFKAEFIKLVESSSLSDEKKNIVCKLGIEALNGEDLSIWK